MVSFNDDDELVVAKAETRSDFMECIIIEDGAERKADLEDLFPIIGKYEMTMQRIIREAGISYINLASALAYLCDESKEMAYSNMPSWSAAELKREISKTEAGNINNEYVQESKKELIELIGKCSRQGDFLWVEYPKNFIWKEAEPKKEKPLKIPRTPLKDFESRIDEGLASGELSIMYYTNNVSHDDIKKAFQNRLNELSKIRSLYIKGKDLTAAALLFETAKIEELCIYDGVDGEWPSFLEKCQTLTDLTLYGEIKEFPSWIRKISSLRELQINYTKIVSLPDWFGELSSLTKLYLTNNIVTLPDCIGNLKNLIKLNISGLPIEKLPDSMVNLKNLQQFILCRSLIEKIPDWIGELKSLTDFYLSDNNNLKTLPDSIGNLQSLSELSLQSNEKLKILPDSIGKLKNLKEIYITDSPIEKIPDWIGDLKSLTVLLLYKNKNLRALPDSIGNLKNLKRLDLSSSPIEELPDTIVNCTALENVDILGTKINTVPDFISSIIYFNDNTITEIIPQDHFISFRSFCNSYYKLVRIILRFSEKARREGLLALEDETEHLAKYFFQQGIRMVVDGTDPETIRQILTTKMERENNFYRKKLMETALEGILYLQAGEPQLKIILRLSSIVDIENNPLNAACAKYFAGDIDAISNIDFESAIIPEDEREEIRFIKRALEICEKARREGPLSLEEHLDKEGIARRDVFEYGLPLVIDNWKIDLIKKILDNLIEQKNDPVQKNFAQAKKAAIISIYEGDSAWILLKKLCAFFGEEIEKEMMNRYE